MEKMTYVSALEVALKSANLPAEVSEKLTALKAQLEKRSNSEHKMTKTQKENEVLANEVYAAMESGRAYTVSEMLKELPVLAGLSNQKVSALMRNMKLAGAVARSEEKGKTYFTKVEEEEAEAE